MFQNVPEVRAIAEIDTNDAVDIAFNFKQLLNITRANSLGYMTLDLFTLHSRMQ